MASCYKVKIIDILLQYSSTLNKLYINQNRSVNIVFTVKTNNGNPLPAYLDIRGLVVSTVNSNTF